VTRGSLLSLARDAVGGAVGVGALAGGAGDAIDEVLVERTSIDMIRAGAADGSLVEMFACGTAAVIAPIGTVVDEGRPLVIGTGDPGAVTIGLRRSLLDVQQGLAPDPHGWMVRVSDLLASHGVDPEDLDDRL
jgi:branched-chain amino acid aminotransferase